MPLPIVLIGVGAAMAAGGVGSLIFNGVRVADANTRLEGIKREHLENLGRAGRAFDETNAVMDKLGVLELEVCKSFDDFSRVFEVIKNRPEFDKVDASDWSVERLDEGQIKEVSVGAGVLLGALGGAGAGAAGGFAAAGATTSAVAAMGVASTGTPIAALGGQAAINATYAALGGGALAAGGGGMAMGAMVLGALGGGAGILVGGIIFHLAAQGICDKVGEAERQKNQAAEEIARMCSFLDDLRPVAERYYDSLARVNDVYKMHLERFRNMVLVDGKTDWSEYSHTEKTIVENLVLLVAVLYSMCKLTIVNKSEGDRALNSVNHEGIEAELDKVRGVLEEKGWTAA